MQFRQNGKNRRCGCMAILLREIFWWKTADFAESLILELWGLVIRPVIMQWPGLFLTAKAESIFCRDLMKELLTERVDGLYGKR